MHYDARTKKFHNIGPEDPRGVLERQKGIENMCERAREREGMRKGEPVQQLPRLSLSSVELPGSQVME